MHLVPPVFVLFHSVWLSSPLIEEMITNRILLGYGSNDQMRVTYLCMDCIQMWIITSLIMVGLRCFVVTMPFSETEQLHFFGNNSPLTSQAFSHGNVGQYTCTNIWMQYYLVLLFRHLHSVSLSSLQLL